jgi:hypothetical protein
MVNGRGATVSPGGSGGCAELEGGGCCREGGGGISDLWRLGDGSELVARWCGEASGVLPRPWVVGGQWAGLEGVGCQRWRADRRRV